MQNKNIKKWLLGSIVTLMTIGAVASYAANAETFYKGVEPLKDAQNASSAANFQASVLLPAFETPKKVSKQYKTTTTYFFNTNANFPAAAAVLQKLKCTADETPVIKGSEVIDCTK